MDEPTDALTDTDTETTSLVKVIDELKTEGEGCGIIYISQYRTV